MVRREIVMWAAVVMLIQKDGSSEQCLINRRIHGIRPYHGERL
jgi:hypothetical protein